MTYERGTDTSRSRSRGIATSRPTPYLDHNPRDGGDYEPQCARWRAPRGAARGVAYRAPRREVGR
jgi:hypothetical protein